MIPSTDSAGRLTIEAAEYIRRFGALVPFDVCPPLLPLLIAALTFAGVPARTGYLIIVLAAYAGGCAALYFLVRRFRPDAAAIAAILYAIGPTRLPPASFNSGSFLLAWSLVPLLLMAVDNARRRLRVLTVVPVLLLAVLIGMAHPARITVRDLIAFAELGVILAAFLRTSGTARGGVAFRRAAVASFIAIACWAWITAIPARDASPGQGGSENDTVFLAGRVNSLATELNPIQAQAVEVILSPGHIEESLLWLRAMAVGSFVSHDRAKYDGSAECVEQQDGACVYSLPDPNPAPAVLVSRHQWEKLLHIRGLYDVEGLQQYVAWSGRPEPAGFRMAEGSTIELQADLGPLDMLLVRRYCDPNWHAYSDAPSPRELKIECDPLGFMVIDPARTGETRVRLEFAPSWCQRLWPDRAHAAPLPAGEFPRITPGGVIEAIKFKLPPFEPGATISIFGHHFDPANTRVRFDAEEGEIVWAGPHQINVRLPQNAPAGELNVVVEASGRQSYAEAIEVAR